MTAFQTKRSGASLSRLLRGFHYCDDRVENVRLVGLDDVAAHDHLVDYKMSLLDVKHYLRPGEQAG